MDIYDLLTEFFSKPTYSRDYVLGATEFAEWLHKQRLDDRFCHCLESYNIYGDNGITKCSGCDKPVWCV